MLISALACTEVARAGAYDDKTIPGIWVKPLVPESVDEPQYPDYDKNNAYQKAKDQFWAGQYRRALVTLGNLKKPRPLDIALLRGESQMILGRYADSLATLSDPAVAQNPAAIVLKARVLAAQGGYSSAAGILEQLTRARPELIPPHYYLGAFREAAGDYPGAIAAYQWFVAPDHNLLQQWIGHPETFDDAADVTLMGRAIDRWATLTLAYQHEFRLHDTVLNMFVRAYDQIDQGYWPAHVAAAQMFFLHDDAPSAKDELQKAIAANPSDISAWILAATLQLKDFNFDGVDRAVAEIRKVNPASVEADLLEARNLLLQRVPDQAIPNLQRVLAQQPRNVEAMGLLAAARALLVQDDAAATLLKQADAIEPASGVAYAEMAQQLADMRQYPRAEVMFKVAVDRCPWWSTPRNGLGLLYTQSGDEDAARRVLDAAHTLDPFNINTTNYLRLLDMMDKLGKTETAHFIIRFDTVQDPMIPEYFGDYLESVYPQVTGLFQFEPTVKTIIEVFPTQDEFAVRTTGGPWLPTVGASTGRIIALTAPRKGEHTMGPFNWSAVLHHEFTHTVTLGATDNRIGHWFTEGLAVQQENSPLRWEWVPMLYDAVSKHELFPIDQLTWAFVRPKRPIDRQLAYAESSWICQYIEHTYGHPAILAMMNEYKLGHPQEDVFQNALHRSTATFFDDYQHWCEAQIATWGYDEATSKKYDQLRADGEDLIANKKYAEAVKVWEEIVTIRPMDLLPHKRLAGLYRAAGDPGKAAQQLATLAAVELQSDVYAKATARAYRDMKNYDEAGKWALRAVYTDPYDVDAHKILAQIDEQVGDARGLAREQRVLLELEHWQDAMSSESGN
jgi:tetratricopeptide (TPR) repeat protein